LFTYLQNIDNTDYESTPNDIKSILFKRDSDETNDALNKIEECSENKYEDNKTFTGTILFKFLY